MERIFLNVRLMRTTLLWGLFTSVLLFALSGSYVLMHIGGSEFPSGDCAIVFGAGVRRNGSPSPAVERRVRAAADLYRDGRVQRVLLSGGKGDIDRPSEASVMRRVALTQGIAPEDLVLEEQSTSTLENLMFSYPLLQGCQRVMLVSDRYHLARIELLARLIGWRNVSAVGAGEDPPLPTLLRSIAREIVGILYYGSALLVR